jgi:hypothetical protein
MILMDELTNHSEEMTQETQETQEVTQTQETAQENTTQQAEKPAPPQTFKVKYNHQEIEVPYEEAITHIQKGMNFDKAVERARQEAAQQARDAVIAEMGYEWKGKPITTEAEYRQALKEKQLEDALRQQYANVPDEIVNKLIELDRFREETLAERKAREEAERNAQKEKDFASRRDFMHDEFLTEFPEYADPEKAKTIPPEVWAEANKWLKSGGREGRRLADALTRYNWRQNMAQQQANEANQANADSSTGSARNQGKAQTFFTREQVANMSREEIRANYEAIKESEKRWK